jgi:hypothetical protein
VDIAAPEYRELIRHRTKFCCGGSPTDQLINPTSQVWEASTIAARTGTGVIPFSTIQQEPLYCECLAEMEHTCEWAVSISEQPPPMERSLKWTKY